MTKKELSVKLFEMYALAESGEQATMVNLFGIKYAAELQNYRIGDIVRGAELYNTYINEVRKGTKLAKYVSIKQKK